MIWMKKDLPTKIPTLYLPTYLCTSIREHPKGAILETCDLWDIWSEWWEDMTWPKNTYLPTFFQLFSKLFSNFFPTFFQLFSKFFFQILSNFFQFFFNFFPNFFQLFPNFVQSFFSNFSNFFELFFQLQLASTYDLQHCKYYSFVSTYDNASTYAVASTENWRILTKLWRLALTVILVENVFQQDHFGYPENSTFGTKKFKSKCAPKLIFHTSESMFGHFSSRSLVYLHYKL